MKKLIIISALLTTACFGTGPGVKPVQLPPLPENLSKKAEPLPPITDPTMGGLVRDGVKTDRMYNDVATRLNAVIDVYQCVRKAVNDKKDPESCFKGE